MATGDSPLVPKSCRLHARLCTHPVGSLIVAAWFPKQLNVIAWEHFMDYEQVEALAALRRLQELLREGSAPFAARVMSELASPPDPDGKLTSTSPLLHELMNEAELIKVEVRAMQQRRGGKLHNDFSPPSVAVDGKTERICKAGWE